MPAFRTILSFSWMPYPRCASSLNRTLCQSSGWGYLSSITVAQFIRPFAVFSSSRPPPSTSNAFMIVQSSHCPLYGASWTYQAQLQTPIAPRCKRVPQDLPLLKPVPDFLWANHWLRAFDDLRHQDRSVLGEKNRDRWGISIPHDCQRWKCVSCAVW